jgi:hypothetical protein
MESSVPDDDSVQTGILLGDLHFSLSALAHCDQQVVDLDGRTTQPSHALAHAFGEAVLAVLERLPGRLSGEQVAILIEVSALLRDMSVEKSVDLWSNLSVQSRPEWRSLRELARRTLKAFGWEDGTAGETGAG